MATSLPICDTCMTDYTTKSASIWCPECEEAICIDCEQQHGRMRLTKNHKTISIEDYQKLHGSVADIKQECKDHNRKIDFYCLIHNERCCVSCVSENHDTCTKIKPLMEVIDGVKSSAAFEDLEDRAKDIRELIGNLIKNKQNQKASFVFQKNEIISEVQKIRKSIYDHLDKLQADLLAKLDNEEKRHCKSIDSFIEKISEMHNNVDQIVNDLNQIKQHATDFQAFFGIHEWNAKIEVQEKDWVSLQTDQIMSTFDIKLELSPILMKLEKDVKEFGKLEVKYSSLKKNISKKEKQGQAPVAVSKTVDNIKLIKICSFQALDGSNRSIYINGIDVSEDGKIVLAENHESNKRLVILNQDGEFNKTIELENQCFDVAFIGENTVATTLAEKKKIVIVDVYLSQVQRSISTSHWCYGIHYTGEQLVVCLDNQTIQFCDLFGNISATVSVARDPMYCSVFNEKLYYTSPEVNAVYSIRLNGEVQWKFHCQNPSGIINDASGNIFVACMHTNKLMVVGRDGKKSRCILTNKDGLKKPRAIHYIPKSNALLVCNESGKCFLYTVT